MQRYDDIEAYLQQHTAVIDWKEKLSDTYALMQEIWPQYEAIFADQDMQALIQNYSFETADIYLPALGQELSKHHLALYYINDDTDSYPLALIPEEDKKPFEEAIKTTEFSYSLQKQKGKKWGAAATRLKVAKTFTFETMALEGRLRLDYPLCKSWSWIKDADGKRKEYFVNTTTWPLTKTEAPSPGYTAYSEEHNIYCALFEKPHSSGDKKQSQDILKFSHTPYDMDSWQEANTGDPLPFLTHPYWLGKDLLLLKDHTAWLVKDAAIGGRQCKKIFTATGELVPTHISYPKAFTLGMDKHFVLINGQFHQLKGETLFPTTIPLFSHLNFSVIHIADGRFIYGADDALLVEVDIEQQRVRWRALEHFDKGPIWVQPLDDGWVCIHSNGRSTKSDRVQLWHIESDSFVRLPKQIFGAYKTHEIIQHPNGYVLVSTNDDAVLRIDDMEEQIQQRPELYYTAQQWSEWVHYSSTLDRLKQWVGRFFGKIIADA